RRPAQRRDPRRGLRRGRPRASARRGPGRGPRRRGRVRRLRPRGALGPRRRSRRPARDREPGRRPDHDPGDAPVRVVVVEDSGLLPDALARLLGDYDIEVAATVATADALLAAAAAHAPDVSVVDVRLPPTFTDEGIRAAIELRERRPGGVRARALPGGRGALRARPAGDADGG